VGRIISYKAESFPIGPKYFRFGKKFCLWVPELYDCVPLFLNLSGDEYVRESEINKSRGDFSAAGGYY